MQKKCFMANLTAELFLTDKTYRYKDSMFDSISVFSGEISEGDKKSFMKHYFVLLKFHLAKKIRSF